MPFIYTKDAVVEFIISLYRQTWYYKYSNNNYGDLFLNEIMQIFIYRHYTQKF